jgi:hypothetical protein
VAAARLRYYRDGKLVDRRKVMVGKPGRETPLLMAPIFRLVANPTWTVPKSIENSEMANSDADYLRSHDMVRRDGYIVQSPGPRNALGLVKFDMRDDQAIYLHDTASRSLFDRSQRHLSHGCVRVDDALGFAQMIAQDQGIQAKWQGARAGEDQQFIDLPKAIPVRLLYETAFLDGEGKVVVRTDPYGWNGPVAKALGFDQGSGHRARAEDVDVGPCASSPEGLTTSLDPPHPCLAFIAPTNSCGRGRNLELPAERVLSRFREVNRPQSLGVLADGGVTARLELLSDIRGDEAGFYSLVALMQCAGHPVEPRWKEVTRPLGQRR